MLIVFENYIKKDSSRPVKLHVVYTMRSLMLALSEIG